jgi:glucose-6-phosphate 1-epimerase
MSVYDLSALNKRFAIANQLEFKEGPGGLTVAEVTNAHAAATIALQGGTIMTFQPHGQAPVLWLSKFAKFVPGKSIRGGNPVCWPWFGPHPTDTNMPTHGFARTIPWEVLRTEVLADGKTQISMKLVKNDTTKAQWPHPSEVQIIITTGPELRVELITRNTGETSFLIGDAFHTYFQVSDIRQVSIHGLEGCPFLDRLEQSKRKIQEGSVTISAETDRIYLSATADCLIEDLKLKRRIRIAKKGSRSTVVWNPWIEKATKMGDFGENGYLGMVCVETANAAEDVVRILPGGEHRLQATFSVEPLP